MKPLALLAVLLVGACVAREPETAWVKPDVSESDRYADVVRCLKDGEQAAPTRLVSTRPDMLGLPTQVDPYDANAGTRRQIVETCMRVSGYSQIRKH